MFITSDSNSNKFILGIDREELAEILLGLIELQGENNSEIARNLRGVIIDETNVTREDAVDRSDNFD